MHLNELMNLEGVMEMEEGVKRERGIYRDRGRAEKKEREWGRKGAGCIFFTVLITISNYAFMIFKFNVNIPTRFKFHEGKDCVCFIGYCVPSTLKSDWHIIRA